MTEVAGSSLQNSRTGQVIRGMYRLGRMIGRGGMGEIYEAQHVTIPKKFAVKILRSEFAEGSEAMKRFHREANIAASVGSVHIVQVFDFNQAEDGSLYMAMELLEGESLADYLNRTGAVDPWRWMVILSQIGIGLEAAHQAGVVHRDLKPDNLFLARNARGDEVLKILDFGISKIKTTETMQTQAGAILGTPNYMSPEQAEGDSANVDARADIFALGAITYEALAGEMAFGGPSLPAVFMKICFEEPEPLAAVAPHLPAGLIQVINRAISKAPEARYETVSAFTQAYRTALENPGMTTAVVSSSTSALMGSETSGAPSTVANPQSTLSGAAAQITLPGAPAPRRSLALPIAGGVAAIIAFIGLIVFLAFGDGEPKTSSHGKAASPDQGSNSNTGQGDGSVATKNPASPEPTLSPDGAVAVPLTRPTPVVIMARARPRARPRPRRRPRFRPRPRPRPRRVVTRPRPRVAAPRPRRRRRNSDIAY